MAQFEPLKDKIEKVGGLVFIAAQKRGGMFNPQKYLEDHPISFPFLLDEDRSVTKQYGVYHLLGIDAINLGSDVPLRLPLRQLVELLLL